MDYNYYNNPIYYPYRANYTNRMSCSYGYPPIYFEHIDCLKNNNSKEYINKCESVKEQNDNRSINNIFESNSNRLQCGEYSVHRRRPN
ncbi:MAG: hypothetical protein IKV94_02155 [Clostridia bacterium]|nr:hypothetical protein [Clostridia bacterium]